MPSNSTFFPNEDKRNRNGDLLYGLIVQHTILQQAISVGLTAIALPTTALQYRKNVIIFNNSSNPIYIGDALVTTASGLPLYPRASINIQIEDAVDVYAIAGTAGNEVRILEGF